MHEDNIKIKWPPPSGTTLNVTTPVYTDLHCTEEIKLLCAGMSETGLDIDDATLQGLSEKDIDDIVESIDPDVSPCRGKGSNAVRLVFTQFTVWCVCA